METRQQQMRSLSGYRWAVLAGGLVLSGGLIASGAIPATREHDATEGGAAVNRAAHASGNSGEEKNLDTKKLEKKLDELLQNQQTILQRLDQVMEELRIVKVRATVR